MIADDKVVLLKEYIEQGNMAVQITPDDQSAVELLKTQLFNSLNVLAPTLNDSDTLKALKLACDIALIMLIDDGESAERNVGLKIEESQSLKMASQSKQLIDSIRKVLSASLKFKLNNSNDSSVYLDNLTVRKKSRQVLLDDKYVDLTTTEFTYLLLLIKKTGELVTRKTLTLNGKVDKNGRSIDVHISNLRKKLGLDSQGRERIKNIRGIGYLFLTYPNH
ncbi:winged helix-turn-helix domain-containing protein [Thalassotalea fonticola]|uniref:Winged helix-turn-helix domain-containing protein n=1 Tax=Thalassotalea fonticola TaxID=3065649 RepID=A0ABZ0GV21_9GAMM|nr:winged helix-turn-helix domain-containing protein [Colwelliaceae bacterium S1-1]